MLDSQYFEVISCKLKENFLSLDCTPVFMNIIWSILQSQEKNYYFIENFLIEATTIKELFMSRTFPMRFHGQDKEDVERISRNMVKGRPVSLKKLFYFYDQIL
jgi:hypothetical protein